MPVKALKKLGQITIKHTKAGLPNPCIKSRKGSGTLLMKNFFDPSTAFDVMVTPHLNPKKEAEVHKLKRAKIVETCLWNTKKKRRKR